MLTIPSRSTKSRTAKIRTTGGFTLLELLTSLVLMGMAAAIATPSYLAWAQNQRLKVAHESVIDVLHQAKRQAVRKKQPQQVSFRTIEQQVEWSLHPAHLPPIQWEKLAADVQLDPETTLRSKQGNRVIQFNDYGEVNGQLGRITLSLRENPKQKKCVMISTLLGKIRRGKMHSRPQRGRYCY